MAVKATGTGPSILRTFTFPDYDAELLASSAAVAPYVIGDLLYASSTTALSKLADVAVGKVLVSGGVGVAPAWSASPALTGLTLVTPLDAPSGGTGQSVYAVGDLLYASTTTALSKLAAVAVNQVLISSGVGVAPAWAPSVTLTTITGTTVIGTTSIRAGTTPATTGVLRVPNNDGLASRNAANSANHFLIYLNATNGVTVGEAALQINLDASDIKWGKALVALGGGAAPTVGTIGGSGPAVAAQNTWMRVLDSTGAAFFVPAWK